MSQIRVMVAGLPGKMAKLVAENIISQADMFLFGAGLSEEDVILQFGNRPIRLVTLEYHETALRVERGNIDLVVDFTQPKSVNRNAELYCAAGVPFVIGTTGGDREKLIQAVKDSGTSAVIAANMAAPVVMFQEMLRFASSTFPNSLKGFRLMIRESHQSTKIDPSGTAISLLDSFAGLGIPFTKDQIIMIRDPLVQEAELHIPAEHLGGHGYHTYILLSPDGTVALRFEHNVLGRNVYVDGVLRAIRFMASRLDVKGQVFSMKDVLQG